MLDLRKYYDFACQLADEAGEIARKHFTPDVAFVNKADDSPVTVADLAINRLVIERCLAAFPEISVLGEEESAGTPGDLIWVCDPIDGTIPYTLGVPISTFSLALVHKGEPVVGVIYDFNNGRKFSAIKGQGAWLNGELFSIPHAEPLKLVILEWWPAAPYSLRGLHESLFAQGYQAPNLASTCFDSTIVARGRAAGVVFGGSSPWDVAAVKVIVEACGGKVTDLAGNEQRYDRSIKGAIIAHPDHFDTLFKTIQTMDKRKS